MIETSLAPSAALVKCFRHEGEGCPRCDGAGYRTRKRCVGCGEPGGSVSEGTGTPLGGRKGEPPYHVNCRRGSGGIGYAGLPSG